MFTIATKIAPATAKQGTRVAARTSEGVRTHIAYDHALSVFENHVAALRVVLAKVPTVTQETEWASGVTEAGLVWVRIRTGPLQSVGAVVVPAPKIKLDGRYTISHEHCGYQNKRYVVRYLNEWVGQDPTRPGAERLALEHQTINQT